jgi:acyl phosphate:glycerol-3-phosphate acyltransferase
MIGFILIVIGILILSYLLGSIPTAYLVARIRRGVDIRYVDVGNVGAGATFRQIGFVEGVIVLIVDIGKGSAAILIAQAVGLDSICVYAAGFAALLGHCYPVWIKFHGGQGIATLIGVFLVLAPWATVVILALIGIAILVIRHLFTAVFIAGPFLPLMIWIFGGSLEVVLYSIVVIAFVVFKTIRRWKELPENVGKTQKPDLKISFKNLFKKKC